MPKLKGVSLVDQAEEEIARLIDIGRIKPGERLTIAKISKEFGTSVVPVREAMARLHSQRVLIFEPNKGYTVAPNPGEMEVAKMMDARLAVEVGALEISFRRVTAQDIEAIRQINEDIKARRYSSTIEDYRSFVKLNTRFHKRILAIADNQLLLEAYETIGFHQKIARTLRGQGVFDIAQLAAEHDRIIDALASGDKDGCRRELTAHITQAFDRLVETGLLEPGP